MFMQLPTQGQFVKDCLAKYRWELIPSDQKWEEAHFPLPECLGGDETVMLWAADHTVQGLLQSVELDYRCFHGKANKKDLYNLQTYYPEYLELFKQLKFKFSSRHGKKTAELKLGVCGQSAEQMTANGKKGGKKTAESKVGIHAPGMQSAGGKKGAAINKANGTGLYDPKIQSAGGKITNAQRWQCLVTKHISNPGGLSRWQKARGIDTKLRVKLNHTGS